jgi:hypothetical protein
MDSNCRATSWTVSKSCKNVKPSPGVDNGHRWFEFQQVRSISASTFAIFLISCVKQLPHHLQRHTALAGLRLRVGLGVA